MARKNSVTIGESFTNNSGDTCTVVNVLNSQDIQVIFNGYSTNHSFMACHLRAGRFKNPLKPTLAGVGYFGVGEYTSTYVNKFNICPYTKWVNMLNRCYCLTNQKNSSYSKVTVDKLWHNFQNFAEWFSDLDSKGFIYPNYELEKDILSYPNRATIYSPTSCVFVPKIINLLFIDPARDLENRGVHFDSKRNKWVVQCSNSFGFKKFVGRFSTKEDALFNYRLRRSLVLEEAISCYSGTLDPRVIDKMEAIYISLRGC